MTPFTRDELRDELRKMAMGRLDAAETLADMLMPDVVALPVLDTPQADAPAPASKKAKKAT